MKFRRFKVGRQPIPRLMIFCFKEKRSAPVPNVEDEAFTSIPDTLHTLVNGDGTDPVVWIRSDQHFFWPQSRIRNIKIARTRKKFLYTLQTLNQR